MSDSHRVIVVGHGEFARGMVTAVQQITGLGDLLVPISTTEEGAQGIESLIKAAVAEHSARIVVTDLPAGSATAAACRVQRALPEIAVIAGINLGGLLDLLQHLERNPAEGAALAVEKGKICMRVIGGGGAD